MVTFTDADDRRQSYKARTNNSTGQTQSMSSFNQNTQNTNDRRERQQRESTNEYINDSSNFQGPGGANEQLAASLKAAGALTSGALGGQALWDRLPEEMYNEILRKGGDPNLYGDEVYSSFAKGTQAYSPTGILSITGPGALYENGELVEGSPAEYNVVNPYSSSFDQNYYGSDYWDDYLGEYYGPNEKTLYSKMKRWDQKSLGEILQEGPAGFGDLQRIYGEELTDTSANPFAAFEAYNKQGSYTPSFGEIITEYIA
mgnify:CR=1 FL=1